MADIRVDAFQMVETSCGVCDHADELRSELELLSLQWDSVLSRWSGVAAVSYAALWEEWHDGAVKLVETLVRSSELLERAAANYVSQEDASACAVRAGI
ncbi:MAG TPA: WXG100 family type VII secretion target [Mycobacterium sp.]|nr:WXG100 family type VII secretion target [Mycobacterium sp.]